MDAKLIEGGGFLSFDPASGNYFGVAYLTLKRKFEIKAVGIIQNRMPDGSEGFSFLLIITFELPTTQPGMGFRLEGIGGLIGINRTIDREALVAGMRDNTLDNILFPDDPVKNAAVIVRQSNAVFPAAQDSHTFGIMFLLAWGTKKLVQLQLGLVLKYQDPTIIALLGVLKIGVEKMVLGKKVEVFRLQVNFKADYEEGKYFAFDANLYKSRFVGFQLLGDLCVRWKGEPEPYFLFSAGGFHPDFQPPGAQPAQGHSAVEVCPRGFGEAVKINGYAYLAVTLQHAPIRRRFRGIHQRLETEHRRQTRLRRHFLPVRESKFQSERKRRSPGQDLGFHHWRHQGEGRTLGHHAVAFCRFGQL